MLQAQVNYWSLMETQRHNVETENLNRENLILTRMSLNETQRHNQQQELLGFSQLRETARHNVQQEQLGFQTLGETIRHNQMVEAENRRHNVSTESQAWASLFETSRHNKSNEAIASFESATGRMNAETKAGELDLSKAKYRTYVQYEVPAITKQAEAAWTRGLASLISSQASMKNAEINERELQIKQQEADAAKKNATTNRWNMWFNLLIPKSGKYYSFGNDTFGFEYNRGGAK